MSAPIVGAAFVPTKKRAAPTGGATQGASKGYKKYKTETGEEREFIPTTPADVIVPISNFGNPEYIKTLEFETVAKDTKASLRYLTVAAADGSRTKGINFVAKGCKMTKQIIRRWLPEGNIKTHSFSINIPVSNEVYQGIYHDKTDKKNPGKVLSCGTLSNRMIEEFMTRPAEIFGPTHDYTLTVATNFEEDKKQLDKLIATEERLIKICETEEEKEAERNRIAEDKLKFSTHKSTYDFFFPKIRIGSQQATEKKTEHGGGFWAPTWKLKIKNNGEDSNDIYPIVSIFDCTTGAEDAAEVPIYFCDQAPTKQQREDPKLGPGMIADWETMHEKVVVQYPSPYDVVGECIVKPAMKPETHTCLIPSYSELTVFGTVLGINLTMGFIDVSTRVTQIFITKQRPAFERRRIGEAPKSLLAFAADIVPDETEEVAPEDAEDNVQ